jgi:hypothetical protein
VSTSVQALLVYGVDLVNADHRWQVEEADDDGALTVPWVGLGRDGDGEPLSDIDTALLMLYAAVPGVPQIAPPWPHQWQDSVFDYWGVRFVPYGTSECTGWLLAAAARSCGLGGVEVLEMRSMAASNDEARRRDQISRACGQLRVTPLAPLSWYLTVASDR